MDFGNPKVYGDTSIFDGIVYLNIPHRFQLVMKGMVSLTLLFSFAALIMIGGDFYTAIDKSEAMDISLFFPFFFLTFLLLNESSTLSGFR